ncbi:hypothetical protein ABPG75_006703 [Micractinium tetrahymenae]
MHTDLTRSVHPGTTSHQLLAELLCAPPPSGRCSSSTWVPWTPLLTQAEVQRGMYYGSGGRLRRFAAKLRAGQPVTVVLLGGSVTNAGELSRQGLSYAARFFGFINSTFPNP